MKELLEGRNAVVEALRAGRPVRRIWLDRGIAGGDRRIAELIRLAKARRVPVSHAHRKEIDRLSGTGVHQGVLADVPLRRRIGLAELLDEVEARGEAPCVVLLDQVQYEHNLGAILRTGEAAGLHAVVIPKRRGAVVTPTVRRVAMGAAEFVDVIGESFMNVLKLLGDRGVRRIGLDPSASHPLYEADLEGPVAFVLGGEAKGLTRPVRERCDDLVSIPMRGRIPSLNVSVVAAIVLYERLRRSLP